MREVYYKSDFDFIMKICDGDGNDLGFPDFDFIAKLWTNEKANALTVSYRGGAMINCFNDRGRVHVVADNHGFGPGILEVEFTALSADGLYGDGTRKDVTVADLEIELSRSESAGSLRIEAVEAENADPGPEDPKPPVEPEKPAKYAVSIPIKARAPKLHDPHNSRRYVTRVNEDGVILASMRPEGMQDLRQGPITVEIPGINSFAVISSCTILSLEDQIPAMIRQEAVDKYIVTPNLPIRKNIDSLLFKLKLTIDKNVRPGTMIMVSFVDGKLKIERAPYSVVRGLKLSKPQLVCSSLDLVKINPDPKDVSVRNFFTAAVNAPCYNVNLQIRRRVRINTSRKKHVDMSLNNRGIAHYWAGCGWRNLIRNRKYDGPRQLIAGVYRLRYKHNNLDASDWTYVSINGHINESSGEYTIKIKEIK